MMPIPVTTSPLFVVFENPGWVDDFWQLIVPRFLGKALYIFLPRQLCMTIPMELSEAARMDGAVIQGTTGSTAAVFVRPRPVGGLRNVRDTISVPAMALPRHCLGAGELHRRRQRLWPRWPESTQPRD